MVELAQIVYSKTFFSFCADILSVVCKGAGCGIINYYFFINVFIVYDYKPP
jgi:hypothetical protein